ncbi:MAG TPA: peptidylprolyl isomerase [Gammaproteobacteria bacterium]
MIEAGKTVAFRYTLRLEDGSVVQSNEDGEPLRYVHGENQLLPALERELEGLDVDQRKQITLAADEAYGEVRPEAFREVPAEQIPENARRVGAQLSAEGYDGPIRVHEVNDDKVVLDFNHPLAGRSLKFDIHVVSIE